MTTIQHILFIGLMLAAAAQLAIAATNLFLVRILGWREALAGQPVLLREVFNVHKVFISITVAIFAVLTLRFARDMVIGDNTIAVWLAGAIGVFWLIRWLMQLGYYSASHWRGKLDRTLVHIALLLTFGLGAAVYLAAAFIK